MANCTKCGAVLRDGAKFCGACGAKVEVRRFCTECGEELEPGENFCPQCGTPAERVPASKAPGAPAEFQEAGLSYFKVETCDGGCRVIKYTGPEEGAAAVPSHMDGKPVVEIGAKTFFECDRLTSVIIPYGVTKIGWWAFNGCWNLTLVTIPDSVTEIDSEAFYNCPSLTEMILPDSVTKIGAGAFSYCDDLAFITIPDSVTEIGEDAFTGCHKLVIITPAGSAAERYAKNNHIAVRNL